MTSTLKMLKKRSDFLTVAKSKRSWVTPGFIIQMHVRNNHNNIQDSDNSVRVGYTVTKKVGKAVIRNRIRRRLRASVNEVLPVYAIDGRDYVFIGRRRAAKRCYSLLVSDLRWALSKLEDSKLKVGVGLGAQQ
ncbi:MAG: ribonuclease P protein component [Pseudomonadota bacterium]|nr:ribonuclease P protein component [Pseudomonadota bacterium]